MVNNTRKIGIITLHGYSNYGNKLQNYALQETINSLGYEAYTLIIRTKESTKSILFRRIKTLLKTPPNKIIISLMERKTQKLFYQNNKELIDNRTKVFKNFSNEYLKEIFYYCEGDDITPEYKYFITGSDQVWNPIYIYDMDKYFLTFAHKEQRISYAASFSCSNIPDEYKEKYRNWILSMSKISVRENTGANIIKDLTGIEVPVLVDPTLLLSKEQWISISKSASNKPPGGYILTYFLGEIDEKTKKDIEGIAKEKKLKIICLADVKNKETYVSGPSEFIDYINSASLLFTDSFHGVVFSILMKTPFVVYKRVSKSASMYSRIETLLDMFNLRSREIQNIKDNKDLFNLDLSHIEPILKLERKKAIDYLREALGA